MQVDLYAPARLGQKAKHITGSVPERRRIDPAAPAIAALRHPALCEREKGHILELKHGTGPPVLEEAAKSADDVWPEVETVDTGRMSRGEEMQ